MQRAECDKKGWQGLLDQIAFNKTAANRYLSSSAYYPIKTACLLSKTLFLKSSWVQLVDWNCPFYDINICDDSSVMVSIERHMWRERLFKVIQGELKTFKLYIKSNQIWTAWLVAVSARDAIAAEDISEEKPRAVYKYIALSIKNSSCSSLHQHKPPWKKLLTNWWWDKDG